MLLTATLTLLAVVVYGGRLGWNALTGSGSEISAGGDTDYLSNVDGALFIGTASLANGVGVHLVGRIPAFVEVTNRGIYVVALEQRAIQELARSSTRAEAEVIASTTQTLDDLQGALFRWRDAVAGQRLGLVAGAKEALTSAIARLEADAERWRALPG